MSCPSKSLPNFRAPEPQEQNPMAKTWQRRVQEAATLNDLTTLELGSQYPWEQREVVRCPNCDRNGVKFKTEHYSGIVHRVDGSRQYHDYCAEAEFTPGSPTMIIFDAAGAVTSEHYPTSHKSSSEGSN